MGALAGGGLGCCSTATVLKMASHPPPGMVQPQRVVNSAEEEKLRPDLTFSYSAQQLKSQVSNVREHWTRVFREELRLSSVVITFQREGRQKYKTCLRDGKRIRRNSERRGNENGAEWRQALNQAK